MSYLTTTLAENASNRYVTIYCFLSVGIFLFFVLKKKFKQNLVDYTIAFILHSIAGYIMSTYIPTHWGGGDLSGYYIKAYQLADLLHNGNINKFITEIGLNTNLLHKDFFGTESTILFFSTIYTLVPACLIGSFFIASTITCISFMYFFNTFKKYVRYQRLFFYLVFFTPSILLLSSFPSKETLTIPITTIFLTLIDKHRTKLNTSIVLAIIFSFLVRKFQGLQILGSYLLIKITNIMNKRLIGIILGLIVLASLLFLQNTTNFQTVAYRINSHVGNSGNLQLSLYPFPLMALQIFRPFPWELSNLSYLTYSLQQFLILMLCIYFISVKFRNIFHVIKNSLVHQIVLVLMLSSWMIYMFNENIGDLARRLLYVLPFIFVIIMANHESN